MPVAGPSRERDKLLQDVKPRLASSSEDDNDEDFGRSAIEQVRSEAAQTRAKELNKRWKELAAEYTKAGLPPPPKPAKAQAPKRERSAVAAPTRFDDDMGGSRRPPARKKSRRMAAVSDDNDSSDEKNLVPTKSTFDPRKKTRELYAKRKLRLSHSLSDDDEADQADEEPAVAPRSMDPEEATEAEIEAHLKRRWVCKEQPEAMSLYRKRMEERFNPLIRLLNIKILITGDESDNENDQSKKARMHMNTDSEDSDEEVRRRLHRKSTQTQSLKTTPDTKEDRKPALDLIDVSMQDVEPATEDEDDSISVAAIKSEADVTPSISMQDDYEPTTEEDEGMSAKGETMAEMELDNEEEGDEMSRMLTASATAKKLDQRREEQRLAELRAAEIRARVKAKSASQRESQQSNADDGEEDVEVLEVQAAAKGKVRRFTEVGSTCSLLTLLSRKPASQFPRKAPKGRRPRFELQDEAQASLGPHPLHPADGSEPRHQVPAPINRFLREYQREGVEFLYRQYSNGIGGILGDDMGLGKTIQVIAFLSAVMEKKGIRKYDHGERERAILRHPKGATPTPTEFGPTCLIVCPASVVHNWAREFATWSYLSVGVYEGSKPAELSKFRNGFYDVLVAGFEAARGDIGLLENLDFSLVIIDEVHRVKNPASGTTKAMQRFKTQLRYGLTGTAIQNRLDEFWCILNWSCPGKVGTLSQWRDYVSSPLKIMHSADATDEELATGRARALALVGELLPNFWLRRTKFDPSVKLQLPPKVDHVVLCPLTQLQLDAYRRLLALQDVQIMLNADRPCPCGAVDGDGMPYRAGMCCYPDWTKMIFKYMDVFRKVSNHLALIYPDPADKNNGNRTKYEQDRQWVQTCFPDDWEQRKSSGLNAFDTALCGKWHALVEMLDVWKENGDKVLIFTMNLKIIALLKNLFEIDAKFSYRVLDGSVPNDERMLLVDQFNDPKGDVFAFILSTRAGGVGLNLTAANRVVIFDPNWNPSHDLQAMDRSYRFGQTREVNVYRFVAAGTLEELIINRQQNKRAMAGIGYEANAERRLYEGVEGDKERKGELYGVKNIFKLTENYSLTTTAIMRCNMADAEDGAVATMVDEDEEDNENAGQKKAAAAKRENAIAGLEQRDAQDFVREVAGLSIKDEDEKDLMPEQRKQRAKIRAEQERIAGILGLAGSTVVNSDATLGSHKREEDRALELFKKGKHQERDRKPFAEGEDAGSSKSRKAAAGKKQKIAPSASAATWNPLERKPKKTRQPETPKPRLPGRVSLSEVAKAEEGPLVEDEKPYIKAEPDAGAPSPSNLARLLTETYTSVRRAKGIPAHVTLAEFIADSQYHDVLTLMRALLHLPSDAERRQLIVHLCDTYLTREQ
ncbi:hypothetical protein ACM66B_006868 [Microbotryomycetes sp. NB124-2]